MNSTTRWIYFNKDYVKSDINIPQINRLVCAHWRKSHTSARDFEVDKDRWRTLCYEVRINKHITVNPLSTHSRESKAIVHVHTPPFATVKERKLGLYTFLSWEHLELLLEIRNINSKYISDINDSLCITKMLLIYLDFYLGFYVNATQMCLAGKVINPLQ